MNTPINLKKPPLDTDSNPTDNRLEDRRFILQFWDSGFVVEKHVSEITPEEAGQMSGEERERYFAMEDLFNETDPDDEYYRVMMLNGSPRQIGTIGESEIIHMSHAEQTEYFAGVSPNEGDADESSTCLDETPDVDESSTTNPTKEHKMNNHAHYMILPVEKHVADITQDEIDAMEHSDREIYNEVLQIWTRDMQGRTSASDDTRNLVERRELDRVNTRLEHVTHQMDVQGVNLSATMTDVATLRSEVYGSINRRINLLGIATTMALFVGFVGYAIIDKLI